MIRFKKISLRGIHPKIKLKFKFSKRYNKIKYLLRVKHFRGRDVHSPFMYGIVRKALMNKRGKHLTINAGLYDFLSNYEYLESSKIRICRVFTYLELENYSTLSNYDNSNSLIVLDDTQNYEQLDKVIQNIKETGNFAFVTVPNIYTNDDARYLWKKVTSDLNCVAVDLYYEGLIFINESLCKQNYKMKF